MPKVCMVKTLARFAISNERRSPFTKGPLELMEIPLLVDAQVNHAGVVDTETEGCAQVARLLKVVNSGLKVDTFIGFELDTFASLGVISLSPLRC
jgi:hypothetical protein